MAINYIIFSHYCCFIYNKGAISGTCGTRGFLDIVIFQVFEHDA